MQRKQVRRVIVDTSVLAMGFETKTFDFVRYEKVARRRKPVPEKYLLCLRVQEHIEEHEADLVPVSVVWRHSGDPRRDKRPPVSTYIAWNARKPWTHFLPGFATRRHPCWQSLKLFMETEAVSPADIQRQRAGVEFLDEMVHRHFCKSFPTPGLFARG